MPQAARTGQQMSTRAIAGMPSSVSVEDRSFEMVIATEHPVRTFIRDPRVADPTVTDCYIEVDEVLLASGLDMSRAARMPLLDNHDVFGGIGRILGKVENLRVDGPRVLGRGLLSNESARERPAFLTDLSEGFYGQISAGYVVNAYDLIERDDDVPLAIATSWTLQEASFVPVGADPNASVRGAARSFPLPTVNVKTRNAKRETPTMDNIEELIEVAEDALAAVEAAVEKAGDEVSDEVLERAGKIRFAKRKARNDDDPKDDEETRRKREEEDKEKEERRKREEEEKPSKEEEEEIRSLRSAARAYGLSSHVDNLILFGARAKEIKAALRSAAASRVPDSNDGGTRSEERPARPRSAPAELDARSIYGRINGKTGG